MAQEQKVTSLDDFTFDDNADWSFGKTVKDKTDTSTVVQKVKAGTTIDEDEDEDDGAATNLEDDETDDDEDDDEAQTTSVKTVKKVETSKETPKEKPKEKPKDKTKDKEEEEEEEPAFDAFTDKPKDKDKTKGKPEAEKPEAEDDEDFYTNLAAELKDKGILENVEIPKDKKLTEEEFFELQDAEIEARVSETMEAFVEKLDEDGKAFIKHKRKGGSTVAFIETYYGSGINYDKFDAEDDAQRDELTRFYVSTVEGLKGDDLEDRLQGLKDSGKDKTKAVEWASKLQKIESRAKQDLEKATNEAFQAKKEADKKFTELLLDALDKTTTVGGFTISKEDKKKLAPFMTKPTIKVGKDKYVPALQVKLAAILNPKNKESRERLIVLSKLVENDFDISDLIPKAETTVVKRANRLLQRSKAGIVAPSGGGGSYGKRVLADMFADEDD